VTLQMGFRLRCVPQWTEAVGDTDSLTLTKASLLSRQEKVQARAPLLKDIITRQEKVAEVTTGPQCHPTASLVVRRELHAGPDLGGGGLDGVGQGGGPTEGHCQPAAPAHTTVQVHPSPRKQLANVGAGVVHGRGQQSSGVRHPVVHIRGGETCDTVVVVVGMPARVGGMRAARGLRQGQAGTSTH
jgi:hypothetical protein